MLVSVVMPVYNASRYLNESIQSLIDQTYSEWELIAVDDGSKDDSWEILNSFKDSRIKVFKRENGGQSAATNTGLKHIKGDYILFFDADDLMDKNKIKTQLDALKREDDNTVAVGQWAFLKDQVDDVQFKEEAVYYTGDPVEWLCRLWSHETMMPNHGYLIPRKVLERAGKYYDENIYLNIDFEYFTRIILASEKVIYCPDSICYYRKGVVGAKTLKPKMEKRLSALNSRRKAIGYLLKKEKSERTIEASRMAVTLLTYSYPEILRFSSKVLSDLHLGKFAKFGGRKFRFLTVLFGFKNAVRVKGMLKI